MTAAFFKEAAAGFFMAIYLIPEQKKNEPKQLHTYLSFVHFLTCLSIAFSSKKQNYIF